MFVYNSYYGKVVTAKNIKIVRDTETIQKVLDSITDASDSNRYVVLVPPGHENERFIYPHKKAQYVKLQYLDNPEGKFQYELWDGCEDLTDWSASNATLELDETNATHGNYCIKVTATGSGDIVIKKDGEFDFSNYQGLMIDVKCKLYDIKGIFVRLFSKRDNWAEPIWFSDVEFFNADASLDTSTDYVTLTLFFNFATIKEHPDFDISNFEQLHITFLSRLDRTISAVYIDNIRLVRTFPYPVLILRYDDLWDDMYRTNKIIAENGIKGNLITPRRSYGGWENGNWTVDMVRDFYNAGWDVVNHSLNHNNFSTADYLQTMEGVRYEVLGMKKWMEEHGFIRCLNMWASPGHSYNAFLVKLLREQQMLCVTGITNNYLCVGNNNVERNAHIGRDLWDSDSQEFIFNSMNTFLSFGTHGILVHLAHQRGPNYTDEMLQEYLDFIQEHFVIMTYSELRERIPFDFTKQQPAKHTGYKATLSEDFEYKYGDGDILVLDAGGVDRNVTPTNEFPPFVKTVIINTGATGNLIFDPSGLNLTIQPGQSANVIYDGDQWRQI